MSQGYVSSRAADVQERLRRGLEHLKGYDAAELAERTINAADGT
jgi:hypothetical protein